MGKVRFSTREAIFLERYWAGALMQDAARAAGYQCRSNQALCNRGRRILNKFLKNPKPLFSPLTGPRAVRIAQSLGNVLDSNSLKMKAVQRQLNAIEVVAKCLDMVD